MMNKAIMIDTDILIDFLRGYEEAASYLKARSKEIVLSAVVVAELYAGVKDDRERAELDEFVALFPVLSVTSEIAKAGGLYKREYHLSHGVGLADALIAATAVAHKADLKTFNIKHYPCILKI